MLSEERKSPMKRIAPTQKAETCLDLQRGFALLTIIFGLVLFSALVAGMLYLSSSSSLETVSSNQSLNAWNLAESGYRYLAANYLNTLDQNDDGDADEEKSAFLELIDGKRFTISNRGSFSLRVMPYYFSNRSGTTSPVTNCTVQMPGSTPPNFTMPVTGKIMIGDDDPSSVPPRDYGHGSFNAATGAFSFRLASPVAIKRGASIYLVLYPSAVQNNLSPGNQLNLALNTYTGDSFPPRNGNIQIGSEQRLYRYDTATVSGNVLSLANLRHSDGSPFNTSVLTTTPVLFKKFLVLKSLGEVGPEQRSLSFYQAIHDSTRQPPPDVINLNTAAALSGNFGRDSSIASSSVETRRFAGGGSGAIANVNTLSVTNRSGGTGLNDYKCGAFWYNNTSKINSNWSITKNLSYDVQVKVSSGYQLKELTMGLAFRAQNTTGTGNPNTFLALTFMLYNLPTLYINQVTSSGNPAITAGDTVTGESSGATGTVQGAPEITAGSWTDGNAAAKLRLVQVTGTFVNNEFLRVNGVRRARALAGNAYMPAANDFIPNEIKPKFDDFSTPNHNIGPLLLVLWERKSDNTFRWLAYKELSYDLYTRGLQDWPSPYGTCTSTCNKYDGQVVNDNASLLIRVKEKKEALLPGFATVKLNEVNAFYGDDSARYTGGRIGNSYAYDIMANRLRYQIGSPSSFPTWPPKWLTSWGPAVDYFSHIENPDTQPQFQWDGINPNVTDIPVLQILHDGTLRLAELVTPDSGSYTQSEIGMIGCGNVTSANHAISFGDFSLKIGINGHEYGGFSGTSMAWE